MLGGIAFSVYEWLKCALARHSFLIVEGSIDKMKNIYPLNSRFTLPFAFVLAVSLLVVSLMFMLPGGLLHAQTPDAIEYPENGTGPVATFTAIDPEGESITWTLAGEDAAEFEIKNGVLRFNNPPDYEDPQGGTSNNSVTYAVIVRASDAVRGMTAMEPVTVEVTNVEEAGTIMLSTLQPQVSVPITATLSDPDTFGGGGAKQPSITWQWYRGNTPIAGATNGAGMLTSMYTPAAGDIGSILSAKAMYDDDEDEDKTTEQDSAHAAREAPTSNVTPIFPTPAGQGTTAQTREIAENTPAGTNIGAPVAASDTDVLTYGLKGNDAATFDINRATGHIVTKDPLDHEVKESYSVMVTATDPFGAEAEVTVTISVTDVNEDPVVTGASSIDLAENNTVVDSTGDTDDYTVTDEDDDQTDDPANFRWLLSGADSSKFDITTTGTTRTLSFKANPDFESPGDSDGNNVYEVTVVVADTEGNTDEQAVMVKVTNVEEMGKITLSTLQPRVGFLLTAALTDPDNITADSVSWQWYREATISITDLNFNTFEPTSLPTVECDDTDEIDEDNCSIKGATSAAYVPVAADVDTNGNTLTAVATYTDGNGDGKDYAATASMNDVLANTINDAPVFPDQDPEMEGRQTAQELTILENSAVDTDIGAAVSATDEDTVALRDLTYSLGGPDAASFKIVRDTGQLQTKAELDKETKDTYTVTVTATDSLSASSTITVTIRVDNVDEMPELGGEAPEEYAENGTGAVATFTAADPEGESITWTLAGEDAAAFSIENGVLRFRSPPDFEGAGDIIYEVTVEASDGGQAATAMEAVTIRVTNVEEPGTVTLNTLQPQVDREIMATLDDPDNEEASTVTWQWYRGNSPISGATNASVVTSTYTPAAGDVGSVLRATAMYNDAEGDDKTARGESFRSVRSAPSSNSTPAFPDQIPATLTIDKTQTREVAENMPAGTNLGAPVIANDPGDVLTYSLGGNEASFEIVRRSGQIRTKAALDFETITSYTVMVTATDPSGAADTAAVTITVTDVNEAPTFNDEAAASIDHEEGTTVLDVDTTDNAADPAEYTVSDPDTIADPVANLRWSLSGADASKFSITDNNNDNATRTLAFEEAPDYESPGDSGANNVYEVTVKVTDSKGNTDEQDVTVKVTNMEELGVVTLSTLQPRVSFPVMATLADPDNITAGSISWQWYRGDVAENGLPMTECVDDSNTCFVKGATSDTYTPVADDLEKTLSAVAQYTDGSPNEGAVKDIVIQPAAETVLADTRNKAPFFPDQDTEMEGEQTDQERSVQENTVSGMLIRIDGNPDALSEPVVAMDFITPNTGEPTSEILTYSLGGPDADSFSINRATAELSTKAPLDYETKNTYTVTVTATDPSGETATVTVTIKITDEDEAPVIMVGGLGISGLSNVRHPENDTDAVATYTAVGPESALTTWSLSGDDASLFSITAGGELSFRAAPDFEMQADADTNNVYMVTIEADDGTNTNSFNVTVTVSDVDEMTPGDGSLLDRYDTNNNNQLDKDEVIAAINDYLFGVGDEQITKDQVIEVINLYLFE